MVFKEIKKKISKTDAVSIILINKDGEIVKNYLTIKQVPKKYNKLKLIGFGFCDNIELDDERYAGNVYKGIEFLLDASDSTKLSLFIRKEVNEDDSGEVEET